MATERATSEERAAFHASLANLAEAADAEMVHEYVELLEARRSRLVDMARSPVMADELAAIDGRVRLLRHRI